MGFNLEAAVSEARAELDSKLLFLMVLGPSGSGKSHLLGTLPGKILYLYTSGERHGAKEATVEAGDRLVPVRLDRHEGKRLTPDETWNRLLEVLGSIDELQGIDSVAFDGCSELEMLIRSTGEWQSRCLTDKGKHSSFKETTATAEMFREVIIALKEMQYQLGTHVATTCILDVTETGKFGEYTEAKPRLQGFSVAESVIQQFDDIITVGKVSNGSSEKHMIQLMTQMSKQSSDEMGNLKRSINFTPRIAGVSAHELPKFTPADISELVDLKK